MKEFIETIAEHPIVSFFLFFGVLILLSEIKDFFNREEK